MSLVLCAFGNGAEDSSMFDFERLEELEHLENGDAITQSDVESGLVRGWEAMTLAGLDCQVLCPEEAVKVVVVFFHGSGEPWRVEKERLFAYGRTKRLIAAHVGIVLPASSMSDAGTHYWYNSDGAAVADLLHKAKKEGLPAQTAAEYRTGKSARSNALELLKDGEPALLDISRANALALVSAVEDSLGIHSSLIVLGGFSQGAAVAMDCALHLLPSVPAAVGFFSGSLMCRRRWRTQFDRHGSLAKDSWSTLPLLQGHGVGDWAIGVNGGRWLHEFCKDELLMQRAEYVEFAGGHTVPSDLAERFIDMVISIASCQLDA